LSFKKAMDIRIVFEQITFVNLVLLMLSISFSLLSDQMRVEKSDINSKIGLLYNCSLITINSAVSSHEAHISNSNEVTCKLIEFSKNYDYRGNLKFFS